MKETASAECSEEADSRESSSPRPAPESTQGGSHPVRREFISVKGWMLTHLVVLGIHKECGEILSFLELRRAYLQKAIETHPDKHPDDDRVKTIFQSVVQAYEVLNKEFEGSPGKVCVSQENAELWADIDKLERRYDAMRQEDAKHERSFDAVIAELLIIEKKLEVNRRLGEEQDRQLEEIRQVIEARSRHRAQSAHTTSSHPVHMMESNDEQHGSNLVTESNTVSTIPALLAEVGSTIPQDAPESPLSQLGQFVRRTNESSKASVTRGATP